MGKKLTFEASMQRLEDIVKQLEQGQISLDEAVRIFEEGIGLYQQCSQQLQAAEKRIELLVKTEQGFQLELMNETEVE